MERENLKCSDEEADMLAHSTKKFKDSHQVAEDKEDNIHAKVGSYKNKLVGSIPGPFEKAFGFASAMQEDIESDNEEEHAQDGSIRVCFSRDDKTCMRAPWYQALIIKPFGRKVGYSFLISKLQSMWNPRGELPIEFYEHNALLKIGRAIGPVLRIDGHTTKGPRGRFARLCVQVNLDKPFIQTIYLGRLKQNIQYEGIGTFCFMYGRIGHNREGGVATPQEVEKAPANQQDEYGDWMIVTRRKLMNMAQDKLTGSFVSQIDESSQTPYDKTLPRAGKVDRAEGKRKAPQIRAARSPREESKNTLSYHNKTVDGKGSNRNGSHSNPRQKAKVTLEIKRA
nr:hypothetical protein CFP56_34576 [Quercus suber]